VEISEYDGYVISDGSDSLEERGFVVELLVEIEEGVVISGGMRCCNEIGCEGLYNLICGIGVKLKIILGNRA
ncbi:asparaginase domain-containing protein, partial [Staphylococcus capitis]|uniref:asparaginase domain-containing protein n=1 Tax=Staphylococcus capitis TaxID=29388 RepID=UPI001642B155